MRGGRDAILKAAIEVFADKGYAGASTREICARAGVTKPVLYYHFHGKEHLYRELMIDCFSHYQKRLLGAAQMGGALRDRLIRMVDSDFRTSREDPVRVRFLLRMIFSVGEQHPLFDYTKEMEQERSLIAGVIQQGIDDGQLAGDAHNLATALMGMQLMNTLENLFTGRSTITRRRASQCVDILLQGCRTR